ncbi:MAG: alpha/beta hydrolase [Solirubrobacterales bacterium]|nr:alpha/beta hydrolase [Solirubrobacterales bacterium]MBV9837701.1 alpha/beta hydrolase [Solirubrobacterales bacterium]
MAKTLPESLQSACTQLGVAGAQLRYMRAGAGEPVVLLHTLRTQLDMFVGVLERLDLSRTELIALDLPGHGHSSAPRVDYTAGYFTDVVEQFLARIDVQDAVLVGESIGATIALTLAARRNQRVQAVIAINPYDYGRWGGIRRSSALANALFTAILWPGIGAAVAGGETKSILRAVLAGGVYDAHVLQPELLAELHQCGARPGHAQALRSLCRQWRSFVAAREHYPQIEAPITLVYGDHDWSRPTEQDSNRGRIPDARLVALERCGHFASLDQPAAIARLITSELP